jgi:hypothetical protein
MHRYYCAMLKELLFGLQYFIAFPKAFGIVSLSQNFRNTFGINSRQLTVGCRQKYKAYKCATQRMLQQRTNSLAPKKYYYALPVLLLFIGMASCKKADITFGNELLDNGHTQIIKTDTVTAQLSTIYIDSFVTNNKSVGLTGIYKDPWFGVVQAKSFVEIAPPSFSDTFSNSTFDSLELVLYLNKTFYGDTTKPVTINVHRLLENIKFEKGKSSLYNTSLFATDAATIGSKTLLVSPNRDDSIRIRLSDELGEEWLSRLASADDVMKSASAFSDYFKGICIAPSGDDGMVFAFKDSIAVNLHFHKNNDLYPQDKQVVFNISNETYQFNNISVDRTGTAISTLSSENNEIISSQTGNAAFSQYITGAVAKIRFPYLRNLLQVQNYVGIAAAELRIRPAANSFDNIFTLPAGMRLTTTDNRNEFGTDISYTDGTGNTVTLTGNLQVDDLYGINTYYSYDLTAYIKSLIEITENNKYGLLISPLPANIATSFDRLVIGDNANTDTKTELILYYLSVQ